MGCDNGGSPQREYGAVWAAVGLDESDVDDIEDSKVVWFDGATLDVIDTLSSFGVVTNDEFDGLPSTEAFIELFENHPEFRAFGCITCDDDAPRVFFTGCELNTPAGIDSEMASKVAELRPDEFPSIKKAVLENFLDATRIELCPESARVDYCFKPESALREGGDAAKETADSGESWR